MSQSEQKRDSVTITALPIKWHIPDNAQSQYANNVLVQSTPHEIIISFFETQLPPLAGTTAENAAKLKDIGYVQANLVARIVVAPGIAPSVINTLQAGLDMYHEAYDPPKAQE